MRQIYKIFLAGHSIRMIKRELERQGIPATHGGKSWSESVIRGILKNEKYCHDSPTIYERPLQAAILAAINKVMSQRTVLLERISNSMRMELVPISGGALSVADIDREIAELNQEFQTLFAASRKGGGYLKYADEFKRITNRTSELKDMRAHLLEQQDSDSAAKRRIDDAMGILNDGSGEITEWKTATILRIALRPT